MTNEERERAVERNDAPADPPKRREVKSVMKEDVFSLAEGDVTLQWPVSLSADSYEDIEDWAKLMLRKIKRSIVAAKPDSEDLDALPGDLREKIAAIIVRKVLQEDYDDLVEGYLDEILMAADEIIQLPAYRAVAETYYKRLSLIQAERGEP